MNSPSLAAALEYIPRWLDFQMRMSQQPGCIIAIAHRDRIVLECAYGHADLATREALTPRHRFRVASHSKSFTAAGVLRLREQGRLRLDDAAGQYVAGLHPGVASATIAQLLSHSAGLVRDGTDSGQFVDRRPFLSARELAADLAAAPVIDANTRFKYSNHGYGLIGLVIEAVTGESFATWITREIIDAVGLKETTPDMPLPRGTPFARGHSGRILLGKRLVIPGDNVTHAIGSAAGFVSTAADLARYFAQLAPGARRSVLSAASRREMTRRQWRNPHASLEQYYGLGTISGSSGGWDWFGHGGGLQGYISSTRVFPSQELTIAVFTNAIDGWAGQWSDGVVNILQAFARDGAPSRKVKGWSGRFWTLWGAMDLVPMGGKVVSVAPGFASPFTDASEIAVTGRNTGRIALANGYGSHGEPVRCVRARSGRITTLWLGGAKLMSGARVGREMEGRYGKKVPRSAKRRGHK
ncbi:MAG TPA: serine hydrolase domain-containing protein [Candidatus Methylomirabilis sp.]|nr:serine hydrolase domain-containing protein [Candidatus Methylomirabilis sp.]